MQEESGEKVTSESNGAAEWLCPLCQKGQTDRASLSQHLTDQHSVLPTCVDRLLDIAVLNQGASGGEEDKGALDSSGALSLKRKPAEDINTDICQSTENPDTTQTLKEKDMEEERILEQEGGEAEPEPEDEGDQLTGAKRLNASENTEIPDDGEKSSGKNGVLAENNTGSFKCDACLETFTSRTALRVHYNSASHIQRMTTGSAKQGTEVDAPAPPVPVLSRPYVSNKPYKCAICRVSYNHSITLDSHMKSVLHHTRSRNAGIVANSVNSAAAVGGNITSAPNTAVSTSGSGTGQLVTTTNCAAPGALMVATAKDGEQIQTSQVAPSLLTSPVASAQAVSAILTLLTSSPSTLSHSLLPSLFAPGAAPGTATPQLVPQPHMVMPLILNGLQAQTQQHPENQQGQLLTQCVPFVGLSTAQQAVLTQRHNSLQNQWPPAGVPTNMQPGLEEHQQSVKSESEQERHCSDERVEEKLSDQIKNKDNGTSVNIKMEKHEEENSRDSAQVSNLESKAKVESNEDSGKALSDSTTDGDSSNNQVDMEVDKAASLNLSPAGTEKSLHNNNLSPSASMRSNSSLSPVHLNLTLSPDSTPQKSQSGTSPCGSLGTPKSSPITNALTNNQTRPHCNTNASIYPILPVLSEFQSEVLWAFLESRSEADAASPPREDCEALGREVGLSEEEVRKWLRQARHARKRQRATDLEHMQGLTGFARTAQSSDNDFDDEESSLIIAEGEDDAEASGSQAIDLSSTRGKRRQRVTGRGGQGESCLTSDSENEVYTSVIVSDEESHNGSLREGPESPAKDEAQRDVHVDKGSAGGKVLRSTTVFLSDAEEEYEDEEGGEGQKSKRKKRKGEFERDDIEVKRERQDPDVDLELEAQGDPPSSQLHSIDQITSGALHSLPLSLTPFSTQYLSPYVLSLTPSMIGDGTKLPVFSNPPTITRFSSSLLSQTPLNPHNQTYQYLSNGGDCESALDLSMGKNSSKSASSSSPLADKIAAQKGQLLDGLGLRPTSKGMVVVQVKPEPVTSMASSNSMSLVNCNNMTKSSIYMRAAEKMNATLLEREREQEREKEKEREHEQQQQQQRKSKGKRYRDMRRSRTIIQAEQLDILYGCYFKDPNPGKHEFEQISEWVHLPKKVVQIWFQNMRARERKGEVRFISDGTLAAVGKPLIKFTWPLSKPIFSNKPASNNAGGITTTPIVRTLMKSESEPVKELGKPAGLKKVTPVPIKPKEIVSAATVSPLSSSASAVPKTKLETTSNVTMVKVAPKVTPPVLLATPKDPIPIAPRPAQKRKRDDESEEEKTDEERDHEDEMSPVPRTTNRMVPKLPTTPINNRPSATTVVPQKQNGLNYWTPKVPIKINTLSREQLALPTHTPSRTIPPPPTPSIAPVSPNTPSSAKVASPSTPVVSKSSPTESSFLTHSSSRRPRTHLSCLQLSILQSCYETCAHPNAMECEAIGTELNLPLKVVQIWFQNTRAKEKRWRLQQEKTSLLPGGKVDMSSGSYLQYNALKANRPILPKPVQLTVTEPPSSPVAGQSVPKETLTGRCDACNVSFESRAAARAHVFSPRHLATLRTTNFGQPTALVNKNGTGNGGHGGVVSSSQANSTSVTSSGAGSGAEMVIDLPPSTATSKS